MFYSKFKLSSDLTVIESYNGLGIYLTSLSYTTCGKAHVHLYPLFPIQKKLKIEARAFQGLICFTLLIL